MAEPSQDILRDLHRRMVRIRLFEEEAGRLMEKAKLPGFLHLYVGEEAVAAGVITHLAETDQVSSTHRGHGHLVAKGGDLKLMFAELFGRSTGYCKGKGGSMHVCDLDRGMLGANGIVGGGVPIAVGAGFADAYLGNGAVSVTFFGDGASNIGAFHEAANMAGALKLPVVFVCENNLYAEYTPQATHQAIVDVADRAQGYGMPGAVVDGMDVVAVYEVAGEAIARTRSGQGPSMIEAKTYRFYDHVGVTGMRYPYRTEEELAAWKARDPITSLEKRMVAQKLASTDELASVWKETQSDVDEAVAFAESSPQPDPADLLADVYSVAVQ